jgi:hypothetical protein
VQRVAALVEESIGLGEIFGGDQEADVISTARPGNKSHDRRVDAAASARLLAALGYLDPGLRAS